MEKEGIFGTVLNIVQAAKARLNPRIVVAQVERVTRFGTLNSQQVHVPGPWGDIALTEPDFGVAIGPFAIIPMPDHFTIYEGGIIDAASLGFLQVDKNGNVNPSILKGRVLEPRGFPVIVTGSPRVFFRRIHCR